MNRKKKEKSILRKEGNVYGLDLFVREPTQRDSASPRTRPWRLTQSTKSQTEGSRGREPRSTATAELFDDRRE